MACITADHITLAGIDPDRYVFYAVDVPDHPLPGRVRISSHRYRAGGAESWIAEQLNAAGIEQVRSEPLRLPYWEPRRWSLTVLGSEGSQPRPATDDPIGIAIVDVQRRVARIRLIPIIYPFPHITGQVMHAERAYAIGETSDGRGEAMTIRLKAAGFIVSVRPFLIPHIPPRINAMIGAACRLLPLGLFRQAVVGPAAVSLCIFPANVDDRVIIVFRISKIIRGHVLSIWLIRFMASAL